MFSSFQDTLLTSGFISKSWPLQETERQKSSDILEELRMQGIIRSQSTTASTEEAYENKVSITTRYGISATVFWLFCELHESQLLYMHSIQTNLLYDFRGKMLNIKPYNEDANKTEASSIHSVVHSFQACFKWVQKRKGQY